ncbi:DUF1289 domain-containing protein [Paraburkholderia sp. A1RI-2L]|uniref:DUF1289 domain-containing protein n=1 Tax=Paraburkholderia sp. A1RI-2L TaxID=3028367 RepID=UPI003B7B2091
MNSNRSPTRAIAQAPSPCINVCRMHEPSGLCEGCLRTIDEIVAWSTLDHAAKRAVWDAIETRHAQWMCRPGVSASALTPAPRTARDAAKAGDAR